MKFFTHRGDLQLTYIKALLFYLIFRCIVIMGAREDLKVFFFSSLYSYNKDKSDLKFGSSHIGEQTILLNYKSLQFTYISGKTFHK